MKRKILYAAAVLLGLASQAWADRIVLVHGAFQDASGWAKTMEILKARGHEVEAVNLPGRNADGDMQAISLASYRDAVLAVINAREEPVFLVGHSFGGFTISNAAESAPAKIRKLIYLAAYVPQSGEPMQMLSAQDKSNKFTNENFVVAKDYS
jgi:pimeloyl-ACP methyl ester carboxylesterase